MGMQEETQMKRIGMLTSGGDCQALNAAMRGVVKGLSENVDELEIYGFLNGYKGLIYGDYRLLTSADFSGILTKGGTILGSSRQPFKLMRVPDKDGIDNDIYGTDVTFGFQSAINIATDAIDCIHTTAASHNRVFIVEVMGHKVGWLTLYAGVAGGADIILLPEIPYDIEKVIAAINKRTKAGKGFTILAVAEGAISKEDAALSKKEYKEKVAKRKYPSVSYEIADRIFEETGVEVRVTVPGHTQRGGSPCPYYRVLCTRLGSAAAQAVMDEDYGNMIAMINGKTKRVPLGEVAGRLKTVDPDCQMIKEAKRIGISFGD